MADFNVRSDSVNVEQIMEQIRARIREKRGVDYTEQQIRELAAVKLEKFLDPRGVRSDLLEQFRKAQPAYTPPELPNYAFEEQTLYESTRPLLRWIRKLLNPLLKLFFNPNPLIQALNIQSRLNTMYGEREARREATRRAFDQLQYELMHNLVIETTRLSIEVKNLKMRVESLASRLEFNERRARALESVVVYKPSPEERAEQPAGAGSNQTRESRSPGRFDPAPSSHREHDQFERRDPSRGSSRPAQESQPRPDQRPPSQVQAVTQPAAGSQPPVSPGSSPQVAAEGPGQRSRRRRRRRGRRGAGSAAAIMGGTAATAGDLQDSGSSEPSSQTESDAVQDTEGVEEIDAGPDPSAASTEEPRRGDDAVGEGATRDQGNTPGSSDTQ